MNESWFWRRYKLNLSFCLLGTIKEILGTAQSVGCTIDGRPPHDVIDDINAGKVECPSVSIKSYYVLEFIYITCWFQLYFFSFLQEWKEDWRQNKNLKISPSVLISFSRSQTGGLIKCHVNGVCVSGGNLRFIESQVNLNKLETSS